MPPPILELRGITKFFGSVPALLAADLDAFPGEVQAVLGENGAGKSTLMKVTYGLLAPDAGTMRWRGAEVRFASALDARRAGIGMVHQEFALVDALSVAENLALSVQPAGRWRWQPGTVAVAAQRIAADLGIELGDLYAPVGTLPVGQRQRLEIIKALAGDIRLLILDEPTAALTPPEVAQLFEVLGRLRRSGTAVLFITHKLAEVMAIADRVTVMRGGRIVARALRTQVTETELAALMVGPLAAPGAAPPAPAGDAPIRLQLTGLSAGGRRGLPALDRVDLRLHAGEIVGIAGVDGNGQAEMFEVLAGMRAPTAGSVLLDGTPVRHFTPAALGEVGVACVPPDRQRQGVVADMSVCENAILNAALLRRLSRAGFTLPAAQRDAAWAMVERYAIKTARLDAPMRSLSGGNVQKLIVARALALAPRVLVAANPTRGLDIAAARAVYGAFDAALAGGTGILLISTDLDELLAHAHRLMVMYRGRLSEALARPFPMARLGALMAGSDVS